MILRQLPIPDASRKKQNSFITLVDQILELKKSGGDTAELEDRIDEMVYDLYDLTEDEKNLIRENS